jgi:hypothetical protein
MSFLSDLNWFSVALGAICFIGIPALSFVGWIISGVMDNKQIEKRNAENEALRKRGVTAPAVVAFARTHMSRSPYGRKEIRIDYEVDVQPEGRTPFRQAFKHWSERRGYTAVAGQLVGEAGRKIWVTYDPNDPSQMIFEYYDEERGKIIEQQELDDRRREFNKRAEGNDDLKRRGEAAEAVITGMDDLNLPYPLKKSRAMHFRLDVTPQSGPGFRAEADALISDAAIEKYSVGKRIYVRFDPLDPKKAVLDSERNKSIK